MTFNVSDIPDLQGKVAIVTGANTGIGRITALEMARKGCHVILACRSEEKTVPVVEEIIKETQNTKVEFMKLDLSSLKSVIKFTDDFRAKNLPLHVLINNAGIMFGVFELTEDGLEKQIATNHFGHFLLTMRLLDILEQNQPSRIVCLSSSFHSMSYRESFLFDKINDSSVYSSNKAYGQSKLCNMLFAKELARRLEGKKIYVNAVHPGVVATDLQRNITATWGPLAIITVKIIRAFALNPLEGSLTSLYVATSADIEQKDIRGKYYCPIAKLTAPKPCGNDMDMALRIWDYTEKILKEKVGEDYIARFEEINKDK